MVMPLQHDIRVRPAHPAACGYDGLPDAFQRGLHRVAAAIGGGVAPRGPLPCRRGVGVGERDPHDPAAFATVAEDVPIVRGGLAADHTFATGPHRARMAQREEARKG